MIYLWNTWVFTVKAQSTVVSRWSTQQPCKHPAASWGNRNSSSNLWRAYHTQILLWAHYFQQSCVVDNVLMPDTQEKWGMVHSSDLPKYSEKWWNEKPAPETMYCLLHNTIWAVSRECYFSWCLKSNWKDRNWRLGKHRNDVSWSWMQSDIWL